MIFKKHVYNLIALLIVLLFTTVILADVIVCPPQGTGRYPTWTRTLNNGEWEITLIDNDGYGGQWYIYSDEEGTDIIRFIKSETDDGGPTYVTVTNELPSEHNCVDGCSGRYVKTVREISQLGDSELWIANVNITDDLGSISAHAITRLDIGGDITGDIYADYAIAYIDVAGNITGDIEVNTDSLFRVSAVGNIGTAILPVNLSAGTFIRKIEATSISAYIEAGTDYSGLETTNGDFTGSLDCNKIIEQAGYSDLVIEGGDLDADITVTTSIDSNIYILTAILTVI